MDEERRGSSEAEEPEGRLDTLLAEHLPGLRGFLRQRAPELVLERETPDDLAQSVCREVLEHALDGRLELRSEGEFKRWLYEAALWKLRSRTRHHRAARRDVAREVPRDVEPTSSTPALDPTVSETPSRVVRGAEEREAVRCAIADLGGRDAEVLRLAILEGLPHRDVARVLDVSEAHSRVLLSRALARLAARLDGEV